MDNPYDSLRLIRTSLAFRTASARRKDTGQHCLIVTPTYDAKLVGARAALARAAAAHATIDHPSIPKTVRLWDVDHRPVLELDAHVLGDGIELLRLCAGRKVTIPIEAADAFIVEIRKAMQGAHCATDPRTMGPYCLGRLSGANVLFTPKGQTLVVGFGHNFALEDEDGNPDPRLPHHAAPELTLGAPASPSGDYVALVAYMRAGLPMVDPRGALTRLVRALTAADDSRLLSLMMLVERKVISAVPAQRATIDEAVALAEQVRAVLGLVPNPSQFAAIVARTFFTNDPQDTGIGTGNRLEVGPEGEWLRCNQKEVHRLRGPMRRMLMVLCDRQLMGLHSPVRTVDLAALVWPDEAMEYDASINRVYVTMNRLRKLVDEGMIERFDDGYRLMPAVEVRTALS